MQHKRALALAAVLTVVIFGFSAYLGITHAQVLNSAARQQLMDQLDSLTVQADAYQKQIDALERQKSSLKRDLALLDPQFDHPPAFPEHPAKGRHDLRAQQ